MPSTYYLYIQNVSVYAAERDAALAESTALKIRVAEAEERAHRYNAVMREAHESISRELDNTRASLQEHERRATQRDQQIFDLNAELERARAQIKDLHGIRDQLEQQVLAAKHDADVANRRSQALDQRELGLKRKLNQLAEDLVASEKDLATTAGNRWNLDRILAECRAELVSTRDALAAARRESEELRERHIEACNALRRERESHSRKYEAATLQIQKQISAAGVVDPSDRAGAQLREGANTQTLKLLEAVQQESDHKDASIARMLKELNRSQKQFKMLEQQNVELVSDSRRLEALNRVLQVENSVAVAAIAGRVPDFG